MNECARTRRNDAVFAVSRVVRAAFARRDAARARDRPPRADAGFARPRARVSRAARANPPCVRRSTNRFAARARSRVFGRSFRGYVLIREISRIRRAIGSIIGARSRDHARRVDDRAVGRAIVIEISVRSRMLKYLRYGMIRARVGDATGRGGRSVAAVSSALLWVSFVAARRRQPSRRARRADAPTTARWTARVARDDARAFASVRRRRASGRRRDARRRRAERRRTDDDDDDDAKGDDAGAVRRERREPTRATTRRAR